MNQRVIAILAGTVALFSAALPADAETLYETESTANGTGGIFRYDTTTGVRTTFATGGLLNIPNTLMFSPDGKTLYVTNTAADSILRFDVATGVASTFATGLQTPYGAALSNDGTTIYAANYSANSIVRFDTTTAASTVFATGGVLSGPGDMILGSGNSLYVANSTDNDILRFDTTTGAGTIFASGSLFNNPAGIAITPDGKTLFISNEFGQVANAGTIVKVDVATGTSTFFVSGGLTGPFGLAVSPDGTTVYVGDQFNGRIVAYDTSTGASGVFASGLSFPSHFAFAPSETPEPSTLIMLCGFSGVATLAAVVRRRRRSAPATEE